MRTGEADKGVRRLWAAAGVACVLAGSLFAASCSKPGQGAEGARAGGRGGRDQAVPVSAATAVTRAVPQVIETFGCAEALSTVSVKTEVSGTLMTVHFRKGQEVKSGDLLFSIDSSPFEAALKQAEARLAADRAQESFARKDAERMAELLKKGIAGESECDKCRSEAEALAATVRGDEAAVESAKIDLESCSLRSPITGRVGNLLVNEGNVVKANDTTLVTIKQIRPIDVFFSVPQNEIASLRKRMAEGKMTVKAFLPNEDTPEVGTVTFIDNAVDRAAGTITLGAEFENTNERLWPGQYVNVTLILSVQENAVLVPSRAVQTGSVGKYVFIIKKDMTVEQRPVTVGPLDGTDVVVEQGVSPGDRVVTDGQLRLESGLRVEVKPDVTSGGPATETTAPARRRQATVPGAAS